jgi:glycosyltransferase involved in cell wall biosynthesis
MLHKLFRNPFKKLIIKILESLIYKKVSKIFALTNKYKQYLIQNGSKKEKCSIVKFPVDLNLFLNPKDFPIYEKYKMIRLDSFKLFYLGYLYEFSALNEIIKKLPNLIKSIPNLQLIIAGEGPLQKEIQRSIKKLKLEKYICLLGHVDFKFIPYLLTKVDICINAYFIDKEMKDLFSAKILQYMAAQKVIISLNQEFINDFKKDHNEGLVVVDSIDKMLSKVLFFYNNKSFLDSCGLKNFQIIAKEHDIEEILNQIELELLKLIKKNTRI